MTPDEDLEKQVLKKFKALNEFIRELQDFAKKTEIDVENERIYLAACAQRNVLRDLLNRK